MRFVLDASVAVGWFLPSDDPVTAATARDLLERGRNLEIEFVVPDSFWAEVGSVFARAVRRKIWIAEDVANALNVLEQVPIVTEAVQPLLSRAMNIAISHQQAVYDTLYVELALARHIEMITADLRLYNALGALYPVRWLGGWIARR